MKPNNEVRLIDANELICRLKSHQKFYKEHAIDFADTIATTVIESCISHVNNSAAIEAEPMRHSIKTLVKTADECKAVLLDHLCTECGSLCTDTDKYCAECGAKMEGGTENA